MHGRLCHRSPKPTHGGTASMPTLSQTKMTEIEKNTILKLISGGRTAEALDEILSMNIPSKDKIIVSQIKASFKNLQMDKLKGVLSFEQETTERNRINDRLLRFLDGDDPDSLGFETRPSGRNWWKYVVGLGVIIGILGGIAEFTGCNLKGLFGRSAGEADTFTVTVFVHGKNGRDVRILKNQGQVMLGLRTNEMPCSINEKGEATFKEIPMGFKGQKVPIRIDHPQPYRATHPDSLYLLEPNAAIYLEVALEGTNRIFGEVMDFETEKPLDSVRVSVENVATYTDQFGWFELDIPENKQRKFQRVDFYKKGYKKEKSDSIAVHIQQEIQFSLHKEKSYLK